MRVQGHGSPSSLKAPRSWERSQPDPRGTQDASGPNAPRATRSGWCPCGSFGSGDGVHESPGEPLVHTGGDSRGPDGECAGNSSPLDHEDSRAASNRFDQLPTVRDPSRAAQYFSLTRRRCSSRIAGVGKRLDTELAPLRPWVGQQLRPIPPRRARRRPPWPPSGPSVSTARHQRMSTTYGDEIKQTIADERVLALGSLGALPGSSTVRADGGDPIR
jgi:hypothetical protein